MNERLACRRWMHLRLWYRVSTGIAASFFRLQPAYNVSFGIKVVRYDDVRKKKPGEHAREAMGGYDTRIQHTEAAN